MEKKDSKVTRRDFLKGAAGVALVSTAGPSMAQDEKPKKPEMPEEKKVQEKQPEGKRSKVVLVRHEKVLDENKKIDDKVLAGMLDDGVMALLGEKTPEAAWAKLVKPSDVVGIKSNVWHYLPTPSGLEQAIKQRAMEVGVEEERISIDDRKVLKDPVFQKATALINARTLRTHHWSGVGSCIKNYIMFHPAPWEWHDDSCADLAGLWDLPIVKGKTRLNILVMLTPLFHGKGPHHFQAKYTWPYKGLVMSIDPVAADATGVRILEAKRKAFFEQDQPFSVPPKHIEVAEKKFKLGVADPARIDLIRLGFKEDSMI